MCSRQRWAYAVDGAACAGATPGTLRATSAAGTPYSRASAAASIARALAPTVVAQARSISATRSATRSACSGWWVDSSTATPCAFSAAISRSTRRWLPKSRLAVGSSITSTAACWASARAMSASWRSPPLISV